MTESIHAGFVRHLRREADRDRDLGETLPTVAPPRVPRGRQGTRTGRE